MKMFQSSAKPLSLWFLLLCLSFALGNLPGCAGGGTSGSGGGGGLQFSGSLRLAQGAPAAGVAVTGAAVPVVRATMLGNTAVTDKTGAFTLFVDAKPDEDVKLSFKGAAIASSYLVTKIPATAAIVKINLTYDDDTESIHEDDVKYEDDEGGEVKESNHGQGQGSEEEGRGEGSGGSPESIDTPEPGSTPESEVNNESESHPESIDTPEPESTPEAENSDDHSMDH